MGDSIFVSQNISKTRPDLSIHVGYSRREIS